jgi:hypothetical protein
MKMEPGPGFDSLSQSYVAGQRDYGNATPRDGGLHGNLKHAGHLFGLRNQFAIVAALREKMFRMGLLEVSAADFIAGDLRRDGEDGNTAAMAVVKTVNQVQISGAAASRTNRQLSGEMGFGARGKRCCFFMA